MACRERSAKPANARAHTRTHARTYRPTPTQTHRHTYTHAYLEIRVDIDAGVTQKADVVYGDGDRVSVPKVEHSSRDAVLAPVEVRHSVIEHSPEWVLQY